MNTRLVVLLLILGATIGIIAFNSNASVNVPERLVAAGGTSGEIYVVGNTLRNVEDRTVRFGQLVMQLNVDIQTRQGLHKVVQIVKLAFISDCHGKNHTILISNNEGMFDSEKNAQGQDLWLVMVTDRIAQLVCDEKYNSVKIISAEEAKKLVPQYSSTTLK